MTAAAGQIVYTQRAARAFRSIKVLHGCILWHGVPDYLNGTELAIVVAGPYALRTYIVTSSRTAWIWKDDIW